MPFTKILVTIVFCVGLCLTAFRSEVALAQSLSVGDFVVPNSPNVQLTGLDGSRTRPLENKMPPWRISRVTSDMVFVRHGRTEANCLKSEVIPTDRAEAFLSVLIEREPENVWALQTRGALYFGMDRIEDAIADFNKALEIGPDDSMLLAWRAKSIAQTKDYDRAMKDADRAIEIDPSNAEAWFVRAMMFFLMDAGERTVNDLTKTVENDPTHWLAWYYRALQHKKDGNSELAFADYSKAIEHNPFDPDPFINRGNISFESKEYRQAIADYSIAIRLSPSDPMPYTNRGAALVELQQSELALLDFDQAIEVGPNYMTTFRLRSRVYEQLFRYEEAIDDLDRFVASAPNYDWGVYRRSRLLAELGEYDSALDDIERAIEIDPNYADYYLEKANYLVQSGESREALIQYSKAIETDSKNYRYYLERGRVRSRLRRYGNALDDLNIAATLQPNDLGVIYLRATVYTSLGNYDKAATDAKKCYELAADNPYVMRQHAWMLATHPDAEKRNPKESLELMSRVMGLSDWSDHEFLETQAAALAVNQKFEEAAAAQQKALDFYGDDPDADMLKRLALYKSGRPFVYDGPVWFSDQ